MGSLDRKTFWTGALRRALAVALGVGSAVSLGHALFPTGAGWPLVHGGLPALVYVAGVRATGARRLTGALVVRGFIVVAVVALAFSSVNDDGVPLVARIGLNFLIPLAVSLLGSATPDRVDRAV